MEELAQQAFDRVFRYLGSPWGSLVEDVLGGETAHLATVSDEERILEVAGVALAALIVLKAQIEASADLSGQTVEARVESLRDVMSRSGRSTPEAADGQAADGQGADGDGAEGH